jgi:hypothetical protein
MTFSLFPTKLRLMLFLFLVLMGSIIVIPTVSADYYGFPMTYLSVVNYADLASYSMDYFGLMVNLVLWYLIAYGIDGVCCIFWKRAPKKKRKR